MGSAKSSPISGRLESVLRNRRQHAGLCLWPCDPALPLRPRLSSSRGFGACPRPGQNTTAEAQTSSRVPTLSRMSEQNDSTAVNTDDDLTHAQDEDSVGIFEELGSLPTGALVTEDGIIPSQVGLRNGWRTRPPVERRSRRYWTCPRGQPRTSTFISRRQASPSRLSRVTWTSMPFAQPTSPW